MLPRLFLLAPLVLVIGCGSAYGSEDEIQTQNMKAGGTKATKAPTPTTTETSKATPTPTPKAESPATPAPVVPSSVDLTWNEASPTAEYSLDIILKTGESIAPCVAVNVLGKGQDLTFKGNCVTPELIIALSDIRDFRICSAEDDNWRDAKCTNANWNRTSSTVSIDN